MSDNKKTEYSKINAKNNMDVQTTEIEEVDKQRKKLDPILDDSAKKRKKSLVGRLVSGIVGPEGLPGIGSYVSEEIIVPAIKNIIVDAVTSGIHMVMYRDGKPNNTTRQTYGSGYRSYGRYNSAPRPSTNYTSRYTSNNPEPSHSDRPRRTGRGLIEEYVIPDRIDAANILTTLTESADMYGSVSVADYYDLINVDSEYTDNNYGWYHDDIIRAVIRPVRGGYVINLPRPEVL